MLLLLDVQSFFLGVMNFNLSADICIKQDMAVYIFVFFNKSTINKCL